MFNNGNNGVYSECQFMFKQKTHITQCALFITLYALRNIIQINTYKILSENCIVTDFKYLFQY